MEESGRGIISKAVSRHLSGGTKESHKILSEDSLYPGRDLNPGPPEFEAGVLSPPPRRTVCTIFNMVQWKLKTILE
jgi:hypothetical protein